MILMKLAWHSLLDRKGSVALSLLAMTVSIFVLLGVDQIRQQTKDNFAKSVSGVDLIVGARTGSLNLLLYSVFRIGTPTNNIRWQTYQAVTENPRVKWAVPISLGDSHKGYRVVGTSSDYFKFFSYANQQSLVFASGGEFDQVFDVVLGAEVAKQLGYQINDDIVLAHGIAATSFSLHDDRPFTVVGILKPTGTPVDQALYVSLEGIEAIHKDWQQGVRIPGQSMSLEQVLNADLQPQSITAFMLGLTSKMATFRVQRDINQYPREPLMAILPGAALSELWQMMGVLENTLLLVSVLVFLAACLGVSAMLLSSMRERRREIQLLRVIGAPPSFLFFLIELEALLITLLGSVFGLGLLAACFTLMRDYVLNEFGLLIDVNIFTSGSFYLLGAIVVTAAIIAIIPSINGYRQAQLMQH